MKTIHDKRLFHGSLSTNNVLIDRFEYLVLSDIGSYKPFYLNLEKLNEYRNFYENDHSSKRCCLAPEKFVLENIVKNENLEEASDELIKSLQKMDLFSLGCLIYELFSIGKHLFDLNSL